LPSALLLACGSRRSRCPRLNSTTGERFTPARLVMPTDSHAAPNGGCYLTTTSSTQTHFTQTVEDGRVHHGNGVRLLWCDTTSTPTTAATAHGQSSKRHQPVPASHVSSTGSFVAMSRWKLRLGYASHPMDSSNKIWFPSLRLYPVVFRKQMVGSRNFLTNWVVDGDPKDFSGSDRCAFADFSFSQKQLIQTPQVSPPLVPSDMVFAAVIIFFIVAAFRGLFLFAAGRCRA
jgi:hypothetical protein